ncbi:MAG: DUF2304 family protein [Methanobrevibacter sp.]|jgi:hypothetical protein|nr:DUF2304 family protein [Candidatus Methanoflexus mossambicus]
MNGVDIIFGNMFLYQIIVILIAILAVSIIFERFVHKKVSLSTFVMWLILWVLLLIFTIVPGFTNFLAKGFGISRGIDLIIVFAIIGAYYLLFRLYLKLEKMQHDITDLIRYLAINEEKKEDIEIKNEK